MRKKWNGFLINFINGIALLLPAAVTVALVRFLVFQINDIVLNPLVKFYASMTGGLELEHVYIVKVLVFFFVVFAMALIGWGAKILFIKRFFSFGEKLLLKVPVMGRIYNALKQVFSAFLGQGKSMFKQVVLIEYPRKGLYSIGFTTGTSKGEIKDAMGENGVTVFVPTTPNPTSGIFLVVPKGNIQFLKMSVEEGMTLVVSGGSVFPPYLGEE